MRVAVLAVDGGVVHVVAHVGQRADGVEQQLLAVFALNVDDPVVAPLVVRHAHDRLAMLRRPAQQRAESSTLPRSKRYLIEVPNVAYKQYSAV